MNEKQYEIINASPKPVRELDVDGRKVKVNPNGKSVIYDSGLAREIDQRYGHKAKGRDAGKVVVVEVDDLNPKKERGHMHVFSMPDMSRVKYKTIAEREAAQAHDSI